MQAVDGNRDGDFRRKSCSLTSVEEPPWWVVDLEDEYDITHVAITNRADENGKICPYCFVHIVFSQNRSLRFLYDHWFLLAKSKF